MDLGQLARALGVFATLDPIEFPLHRAQLLLEVAKSGQVNRHGQAGYRLVETIRDPMQSRRFRVRLTPRGRALLRQLEAL